MRKLTIRSLTAMALLLAVVGRRMCASPIRALTAATVALGLLVFPAASFGAAQPQWVTFSDSYGFPEDDSGTCLGPGAVGTLAATEDVVGHVVDTPSGLHMRLTSVADFRVDYQDGRYALGTIIDHFGGLMPSDGGTNNGTSAAQGEGTVYNADDQPITFVRLRSNSHFTVHDLNGNGQPDPGEISVNFNHFRLFCT